MTGCERIGDRVDRYYSTLEQGVFREWYDTWLGMICGESGFGEEVINQLVRLYACVNVH